MSQELIDYKSHPVKSQEELFSQYPPDLLLVIEEILKTKKTYQLIFQDLIDMMKYGFEVAEIRRRTIFFKFKRSDKVTRSMPMNTFIANLVFWKPLIAIDMVGILDESWIFDFTKFSAKTLMDYINEKILPVYDTDFATQNAMVDDLYHDIISISHAFCLLMGMGVSLYDLHQLELRDPEVSHLMRDPVDETLEPHEIETILNQRNRDLIDHIVQDPVGNDYKPFWTTGTGLKEAQFREYLVMIGFKADINGNTVPILIRNNFLFHGLGKPSYLYLNAISGRKALILTKLSMGRPGAMSKKLSFNSLSSILRRDFEVCRSGATIQYEIKDDMFLKLLNGRNYYDTRGVMHMLDYEKDKDLIGKIVQFKSPLTCASKEGVCKDCYGHMFRINQELASAGGLAAIKITEPVGQSILSSKHSQSTSSSELKLNDEFDSIFDVSSSVVSVKEESDMDANLYIRLGDVCIEEFDDSDACYVMYYDVLDEKGNFLFRVEEANGAKFYLNDSLLAMYKTKIRTRNPDPIFSLEDIDDGESLFTIEVKNKELTDVLKVFTRVLNSKEHHGAKTMSELCQIFAEKLIQMGIRYELVHMEMILKALIRKKTNILEEPDFSLGGNMSDYQILKLDDALFHHPNALVGLSYGYLRKALMSSELYEKTSPGPLDPLAVSQLSQFLP